MNKTISESRIVTNCDFCNSDKLEILDSAADVVKCSVCGYIFVSKQPDLAEIDRLYPEIHYEQWYKNEPGRIKMWGKRVDFVNKFIDSGNSLDIGCGDGYFISLMKNRGFNVLGTETSSGAVKYAKEKRGLDIYHGDAINLDSGYNNYFDLVTLWHVLEHVPSPSKILEKVKRICKKNGIIIIAVPNHYNWKLPLKKLLNKKIFYQFSERDEVHLSHFSCSTLKKYLQKFNFEILDFGADDFYPEPDLLTGFRYFINNSILSKLNVNISSTIRVVAVNK